MNKLIKIILIIVMATAAVFTASCSVEYCVSGKELRKAENTLSESRANWERIAAEKETLQEELTEKQNALKEAQLSYSESVEKAEKLKSEIQSLQNDIDMLKNEH